MSDLQSHALAVERTARYYTLGEAGPETASVWFALHGYAQPAQYFARSFTSVAGPERLIVLPEALSRFYMQVGEARRVGASWMTREDRLNEIADAVGYLDRLYTRTMEAVPESATVGVLGFSQGATMACRWALKSRVLRADRLVLWAGGLPHDEDLATHAHTLSRLRPDFVVGTRDAYITPERKADELARLDVAAIPYRLHEFDGDHRVEPVLLREVMAGEAAASV